MSHSLCKLISVFVAVWCMCGVAGCKKSSQQPKQISGAGATFPYPIYAQWAYQYNKLKQVRLNYQSIGSGGGIRQVSAKTVDFGATDAPLKKAELDKRELIQFPMVVGGVVLVVNLQGLNKGQLRLTPELLTAIFLGEIKNWKDPKIAAVNPGLQLPDKDITVVHRADGSGTTWIFTNYLSKISPRWQKKFGFGKAIQWPVGVGGKGNEGVAAYVKRVNGAIGYVEFAYAYQSKMTYTLLKNQAGQFVAPTLQTFQAAAANANWKDAPGFYLVLTNQPGARSWPITGASFILLPKQQPSKEKALNMLKFFHWCFTQGQKMARQLHYVPIPPNVVKLVDQAWHQKIRAGDQVVWSASR